MGVVARARVGVATAMEAGTAGASAGTAAHTACCRGILSPNSTHRCNVHHSTDHQDASTRMAWPHRHWARCRSSFGSNSPSHRTTSRTSRGTRSRSMLFRSLPFVRHSGRPHCRPLSGCWRDRSRVRCNQPSLHPCFCSRRRTSNSLAIEATAEEVAEEVTEVAARAARSADCRRMARTPTRECCLREQGFGTRFRQQAAAFNMRGIRSSGARVGCGGTDR